MIVSDVALEVGEICAPSLDDAMFGDVEMRIDIPIGNRKLLVSFLESSAEGVKGETGVSFSRVQDDSSGECIAVTLHGPAGAVFKACHTLQEAVPGIGDVMASFEVKNKKDIAGIIGSRGSTVSRLETMTHCHIRTPPKHDPSRVITVQGGSGREVLSCLAMLAHELGRALHPQRSIFSAMVSPFFPTFTPHAPAPAPPPMYVPPYGYAVPMAPAYAYAPDGMVYPTQMPVTHSYVAPLNIGFGHMPPGHLGVPMRSTVQPGLSAPMQPVMPIPYHHHPVPEGVTLSMEFAPEKAGLVFGRGGKTLATLKREMGVRIAVDADRGRILITAATMRAARQAQQAIQNILSSSESHRLILYRHPAAANTVRFVPFVDVALRRAASDKMYVLVAADGSDESAAGRTHATSIGSSEDGDPHFFRGMDISAIRTHLRECLDALHHQAGHVELLCRFGKMIFTHVPDDLVDVALPADAMYNVVRSRQIHYTFEGGAGIPEEAITAAVARYSGAGECATRRVYYLSVVPDAALGLDRRWRLDVLLERREAAQEGSHAPWPDASIHFVGVREPYMKPFKADVISLRRDALDVRIAVRASPRPISAEVKARVEEFASTIRSASQLELEYPAKSHFRVTGCALKTVQTMRVAGQNLAVECVQHEYQDSSRRYEFAATTIAMEDILGRGGSGTVSEGLAWAPDAVMAEFDHMAEKAFELGDTLLPASPD